MKLSTCFADFSSPISTLVVGSIDSSADSASYPASARALRTASRSAGWVVTTSAPPSGGLTSSAPASIAAKLSSSGSLPFSGRLMMPFCSNCQATGVSEPPALLKMLRTSPAVRLRLSVIVATITATFDGPKPSYVISSYCSASAPAPVARSMARLMLSAGMLFERALSTAMRSR